METVTAADGTAIAYERTGSGPPLVLVHGSTATHTAWEPVRPAFAEQFTVYAMDRRGLGESEDADEYALEREAEDVTALVESLAAPAVLFGHSYGALVSLEAALRTDGLRVLVLYEPVFPVGDDELYAEALLAEMGTLHDEGASEELLVVFLEEIVELPPAEIDALRSDASWPALVETSRTLYRETATEHEYEFDPSRVGELPTPTVLVTGTESPTDFRAPTAALDEALPDSRVVTLDERGHDAIHAAPELVVEEVLAAIRASE
ncbi:alpha/beta fold hydrolase [Natronococcus occultus]|uniref:Putative hydrolase or acyltransferase of alpha/beta superfamily n=1 Tax=Natronococcus occultus SP4 TaxID=694430 RepID=L0K0B7_9EURY|nr:alpha/beta hydrolase [Natronococcus occultus]AGB38742.1 putative hydrolase or acyltransferase of alpha/beta superfamily [Natronococcus occultus SP4]